MSYIGIITTVGTSLKDNFKKYLEEKYKIFLNDDELFKCINEYLNKKDDCKYYKEFIENEFLNPINNGAPLKSFPSAELQSLYLFFERDENEGDSYYIYLLYTQEEGKNCANAIKNTLEKLKGAFGIQEIHLKKFEFDINDNEEFKKGISNIFTEIRGTIQEFKSKNCDKIFINITGGYKGLIPFLSLYGFLQEEVEGMIYAYESSKDILNIPPLPLEWNMRYLDEIRSLLNLEELDKDQFEILPDKIKNLYEKDGNKYKRTPIAKTLSEEYISKRHTRFGYGAPLLERIKDNNLRKELKSYITGKWEYLWIGDQIPETVEHSRGHSLRLLELAHQVLKMTNIDLSDHDLFALISAIWLHDIGHSGLEYNYDSIKIPVWMFPSLVRNWHNLLSYEKIKNENFFNDDKTSETIALISKYHRNDMPITNNDSWKDSIFENVVVPPLSEELNGKEMKIKGQPLCKDKVLLITAFLRFIDGCDVQSDRVVNNDYLYMRNKRTLEEIKTYYEVLEKNYKEMLECIDYELSEKIFAIIEKGISLNESIMKNGITTNTNIFSLKKLDECSLKNIEKEILKEVKKILLEDENCFEFLTPLSLADKIIFKLRQAFHFLKHHSIKLTYITKDNNKLRVMLLVEGNNINDELMEEIGKEIYKEYEKVKNILSFEVDGIYLTYTDLKSEKIYPKGEEI